jgi:hypothetical protein
MAKSKTPPAAPTGNPINRGDLENRLRAIKSDVDTVKESTIGAGIAAVGAIAVVIVILAFLMGRSRGLQKLSFVEVRRG